MRDIKDVLKFIKKGSNNEKKQDRANKIFDNFNKKIPSLREIREVFYNKYVIETINEIRKQEEKKHIDKALCTTLTQYLLCIVSLGCCHRQGVSTNMTVEELLSTTESNGKICIRVRQHKTGNNYPAVVVLTTEEYALFKLYYMYVRPQNVLVNNFFLTSTGTIIKNPGKDIQRLQDKYKLTHYTATMA